MRRLLALLPVVTIAVVGLVPDAPAGAQAEPATFGYTVLSTFTEEEGVTCRLATVDFATGEVVALPAPQSATACAGDLAFAPDGKLYGLVQVSEPPNVPPTSQYAQLVTFDLADGPAQGAATVVGRVGSFERSLGGQVKGPVPWGGITFDADGVLYALLAADKDAPGHDPECAATSPELLTFCVYRVLDPSQPAATELVGAPFDGSDTSDDLPGTLGASCDAVYTALVAETNEGDLSSVSTLSTADGSATPIGDLSTPLALLGADLDRSATFWGIAQRRDPETGEAASDVVTLDPAGGTPLETVIAAITLPDVEFASITALAVAPLDCAPPPVVLEPTFTG